MEKSRARDVVDFRRKDHVAGRLWLWFGCSCNGRLSGSQGKGEGGFQVGIYAGTAKGYHVQPDSELCSQLRRLPGLPQAD